METNHIILIACLCAGGALIIALAFIISSCRRQRKTGDSPHRIIRRLSSFLKRETDNPIFFPDEEDAEKGNPKVPESSPTRLGPIPEGIVDSAATNAGNVPDPSSSTTSPVTCDVPELPGPATPVKPPPTAQLSPREQRLMELRDVRLRLQADEDLRLKESLAAIDMLPDSP